MDTITSLNLEAFLEALSQLDEATQTELVEQLNQIVQEYPQMQALHEAAVARLLENTEEISKSKESPVSANKIPFWQRATPSERADELLEWVAQLPETNLTLPDEAFDRSSIYK